MPTRRRVIANLGLAIPLVLAALVPLLVQLRQDRSAREAEPVRLESIRPSHETTFAAPTTPTAATTLARTPDAFATPASDQSPEASDAARGEPARPGEISAPRLPSLDCVIEPWVIVQISSPMEGLIEKIAVDRGEYVQAGQTLVELDSGVESAAVEVARARATMTGQLRAREATLELGRRRKNRMDALFDREAISLEIQDEVETEARLAEHELKAARESRQVASLEHQQALEILQRRIIRSPIDGFVMERRMSRGEVVDDQTILTVAQVDPLRVEVIAPSALYGRISVGAEAEVFPELPLDTVHRARVDLVDPVIDAASGTFGVRLKLENADHAIPGGLRCTVRFLSNGEE
jgi:RND family efflux transporter MFP subunit